MIFTLKTTILTNKMKSIFYSKMSKLRDFSKINYIILDKKNITD